ncbi:MAG TPA: TauD/TfdA family dioxygenase [Frankiaceae bacterium]|jgi:alpha-ketoglutarate-dependent taurine dioxygenase|nr:TauD/TfdA family dioxygenase [Frankiaceae bacterium]
MTASGPRFRKPAAPVRVSQAELVSTGHLEGLPALPLVMRPLAGDVDVAGWAADSRDEIAGHLRRHGGILLRGFGVDSLDALRAVVTAVSGGLLEYTERSSPRTHLSDQVYTSTDHPAQEPIALHCEQSYTLNWPLKIWFLCLQRAQEGGNTPIADTREIHRRIGADTLERFRAKGVLYVRTYGSGAGLPWQEAFGTTDRAAVEDHCRRNRIDWTWKDGDLLQTRQVRPALRTHPHTHEEVWFNHALFFNLASLEPAAREALLAVLAEDEVPYNTFYGDGSRIEASALEEIRAAYDAATVTFDWEEGDVLLLDNMLVAHGREPFRGPRRVVVAMSEPCTGG